MLGRRKIGTRGRVVLVGTAMFLLGRIAAAEPETVRLDYAAATGCPDATAFVRSLRERTMRFREAGPNEPARRFLVRVKAVGSAFAGRLEIRSPDGPISVRNVEATLCEEVASALALITALTIDPNALSGVAKGASKTEPETPPVAAATPPNRPDPSTSAAAATLPPPGTQDPSRPWRWSAGLGGHSTFLVSPSVGYGGEFFVEAEAPASSRLKPVVRMGLFLNQSDVDLASGAAARFQWALAEVEGCPVRLGGPRLALHPCLVFRLGVLRGEGRKISKPSSSTSPWSDAGLVLRIRLAVTADLLLEAQGGILVPLHRPTFEIVDMGAPLTAYSVPRLGGMAGIGMAYRFR